MAGSGSFRLSDGTTSIGAVCPPDYMKSRTTDVTTFFHQTLAQAPQLAERLTDATLIGPATATGNYSYRSRTMFGRNYLLVGDAYAFIDPVFSTGVYLAMSSAFRAADAVATALRQPADAARALARFEADVQRATRAIFVVHLPHEPAGAARSVHESAQSCSGLQEAMLSLLSGDVFRPSPVHRRLTLFKVLYYGKSLHRQLTMRKPQPAEA